MVSAYSRSRDIRFTALYEVCVLWFVFERASPKWTAP